VSEAGRDQRVPGYLGRVLGVGCEATGTCFQVSAGVVITAWHVLDAVGAGEVGAAVGVDPLEGGTRRDGEVVAVDALADLGVVRLSEPLGGCVKGLAATDEAAMNEGVVVTGVSRLDDPEHEHRYMDASGTWAGGTMRDDQLPLGRVRCQDVLRGMSGAPVRRQADDVVVGVVSGRYNSADGWLRDSVWVARCERVEALCSEIGVPELERIGLVGALDVMLRVDDRRVWLSGGGVDVSEEHAGVSPGLAGAINEVRRARARVGSSREPPSGVRDAGGEVAMDRAGRLLGESFLPAKLAGALSERLDRAKRAHQPLQLGIECAGELARLPWEALPDPRTGGALALDPLVNVYRRVRGGTPPPVPAPLRILMAISSPEHGGGTVLDYERELRNVLAAVRSARRGDAHVRVVAFATTAQIRSALELEPVHVLHLSGHGTPGDLVLENQDGSARELDADAFVDEAIPPGKMPALIALAACHTNVASAADAPSFATRLLQRGASVVIATETSVTDVYATRVFARVYERLADAAIPDPVAAVCDARRVVQRDLDAAETEREQIIGALGEWSVLSVLASAGSVAVFDPAIRKPPPDPPTRFAIGKVAARAVGEFVGRRSEQRRWPVELLAHECSGLVLHGIGGIGKTTLAAELASRVLERKPDTARVVLEGELTIERVLGAIIGALRRHLIRKQQLGGERATALEGAGRSDVAWADRLALLREGGLAAVPLLVVFDNFEDNLHREGRVATVREPTLAALLAALVRDPGAWRLLVTSRYQFTLPEQAHQQLAYKAVGALTAAETRKLVWSLPALDRTLDDAQVEQVWRMIGGHPRSLEYLDALLSQGKGRYTDITARLAAALHKQLSVRDVEALFDAQWQLDDAIAQVATLAADDVLLDDLFGSLASTPGAQALLIGASVYRAPVDVGALLFQVGEHDDSAASVPDYDGATQRISARLQAAGISTDALIDSEELPENVLADLAAEFKELQRPPAPPRRPPERLDDMVAACVASTLLWADDVDDGSTKAHVFVHRWTASELQRRLSHTRGQDVIDAHLRAAEYWEWRVATWVRDLHAAMHDLLEARHHLLAAGRLDRVTTVTKIACGQLHEWGAWDQEAALLRQTLAHLSSAGEEDGSLIRQLGIVAHVRGELQEAKALYRRSIKVDERLGDRAGVASGYGQLGILAYDRGDLRQAEALCRRSLKIHDRLENQVGMAAGYHQLGILTQHRGDLVEAEAWYRRSLEIHERLNDRAGVAAGYGQLGRLAQERGDLVEAEALCRRSLQIYKLLGDQTGIATGFQTLGVLAQERGDLMEAEALCHRSLEICERLGDQSGIATCHRELGKLAYDRGDLVEAEALCRRSLEIDERLGNRADVAAGYGRLGVLVQERGDLVEAEALCRRSLEVYEQLEDQTGIASCHLQLGVLVQERGDPAEAEALYRRSLQIREELEDQAGMVTCYRRLGKLAYDRGDLVEAEALYRRSLEIHEQLGNEAGIAVSYHQLAILAYDRGDLGEAEALYRRALEIHEQLGNEAGIAASYHQLGMLAHVRGHLREAEAFYRRSLEIKERLGNLAGMGNSISQLGVLAADRGDFEGAIGLHGQALVIRAAIGLADMGLDMQRLAGHRARIGDEALLRALGHAIGPKGAEAVLALLDQAAGIEESR
jgi:tetratricopeptide (TPR) repeat protein